VGRCGRSVTEVAKELGCDWHTVNDALLAYGEVLIDDEGRFGVVEALFVREGEYRRQCYSTQIVDVGCGQLLDLVPGRSGAAPTVWLRARGEDWLSHVRYATLDLSGPYRSVFNNTVPQATQVADPFHVVKLANLKLDEAIAEGNRQPPVLVNGTFETWYEWHQLTSSAR
jgi:transposase